MNSIILAIVGMCGSGKSEVSNYLEQKGFPGVYFGKITMEWLREKNMEVIPENERLARETIRKEYGMGAFAILSLEKIARLLGNGDMVYIDGLYSMEEYEILEKRFSGKVILVEIYADKKVRHTRLGERNFRALTVAECHDRDRLEVKNLNKGGPIALSDYKIDNNSDVIKLQKQVNHLLQKLNICNDNRK